MSAVSGQSTAAFHELRPGQIAARKRECPVAYLAFGILEWHGLHNPYGLDGLKAYGIAKLLAERIGGLAMPPMYWGDHRGEICERHLDGQELVEAADLRAEVHGSNQTGRVEGEASGRRRWNTGDIMCGALEVPRDAFARNADRSVREGGWRLWEELAVHAFFQLESYGFEAIVAIPGHYPLFDPLERAIARYRQEGGTCRLLVLNDAVYSDTGMGDHAAAYETSLLMALQPDTVDLGALDPDPGVPPAGIALGPDPRTTASRSYGESALQRMIEDMQGKVAQLLEQP